MMLLKSILSTPPTSFLVDPPASDTEDVKLTNPLVNLNSPKFVQSVHSKAEPGSSQHKNTNKSKFAALSKEELLQQIKVRETELQRLLQGVGTQQFDSPPGGKWKINAQTLAGKPVPQGEWIKPPSER